MKFQIAPVGAAIAALLLLVARAPITAQQGPFSPGDDLIARATEHFALLHQLDPGESSQAVMAGPADWRAAIDAAWGPGLPTARKLEIFDLFWKTVDERLATFQGIEDVDWQALRDRYRPEVASGVSRGRFAAIMNALALALRESHTVASDRLVNQQTLPRPGVPLLSIGPWLENTFGACVTAQDDGSALVIDVAPNHPLGLEPGDRVLGFEGRPWTQILPELIQAELPHSARFWGASPSSFEHTFVASGPLNWHLFSSIDVRKFHGGHVEHLSTAALTGGPISRFCTEQPDLPGIAKPRPRETGFQNLVSWGVLPGTRIGYIYVWGWSGNAVSREFAQAVEELTQRQSTDGLIIDFRFNLGGGMFFSNPGLAMLFERPMPTIGFAVRLHPYDHFHLAQAPPAYYLLDFPAEVVPPYGHPDHRSYAKPIAVLTGPGALSAGDQVALRMTFHPAVRVFGKSTAAAFNSPLPINLDSGWFSRFAVADAYIVGDPHNYLTHDEFPVDERVWLRPEDVAAGRDTVVEAARRWILGAR